MPAAVLLPCQHAMWVQEAVERLLQRAEGMYAEPCHEIYDKEFFGFTFGTYAGPAKSFSWLPKSSSTVHPMPVLAARPPSKHKLSLSRPTSRASSLHRLSVPSLASSLHQLRTSAVAASSHGLIAASKAVSKRLLRLSLHRSAIAPLPVEAEQPGLMSQQQAYSRLDTSSFSHMAPSQGTSRRRASFSAGPAALSSSAKLQQQQSGGVLDGTKAPLPQTKNILRSGSSLAASDAPSESSLQQHGLIPRASSDLPLARTKSILRSRSSLTAASVFDGALSLSSSDEEGSLAVPEDLIEAAMFLLRDRTLADPQAEVCQVPYASQHGLIHTVFLTAQLHVPGVKVK